MKCALLCLSVVWSTASMHKGIIRNRLSGIVRQGIMIERSTDYNHVLTAVPEKVGPGNWNKKYVSSWDAAVKDLSICLVVCDTMQFNGLGLRKLNDGLCLCASWLNRFGLMFAFSSFVICRLTNCRNNYRIVVSLEKVDVLHGTRQPSTQKSPSRPRNRQVTEVITIFGRLLLLRRNPSYYRECLI